MPNTYTQTFDLVKKQAGITFTLASGPRAISYDNGIVSLQGAPTPIVGSLDDFTWQTNVIALWIQAIIAQRIYVGSQAAQIYEQQIEIGALTLSGYYDATSKLTIPAINGGPTSITFAFANVGGTVTRPAREPSRVTFANFIALNQQALTFITVCQAGEVPAANASVVGPQGLSAYQIALQNGYTGSSQQWLASLVGPQGVAGVFPQPLLLPLRLVTVSTVIVPASDYTIAVNTTSGALSVTLPPNPANGERYEIIRTVGANQLTINRNGNSIDGGTTNPTVAVKHTVRVTFVAGWGWVTAESASA